MGSPRPAAQQILVRATVTCLFIHSLLFRFSSCCSNREQFVQRTVKKAAFPPPVLMSSSSSSSSTASLPLSLLPSPLSGCLLPLYTLPPALSCSLPPSLLSLPLSSGYMQQGTNSSGERQTAKGELEMRRGEERRRGGGRRFETERWFRLKESKTTANDRLTGNERRRKA